MGLKTLKDIEKEVLDLHTGILAHKIIKHIFKKIRQEVVKWINSRPIYNNKMAIENQADCWVIDWIKHFFNLTEEDLK